MRRDTIRTMITTAAALVSLGGCGDIETTPVTGESGPELPSGTGLERASQGLTPELYGPGATWYAYDSRTHTLSPDPVVYLVRRGDGSMTLVEVMNYYDERGTSGFFTLRLRSRREGTWDTEPTQLVLAENAKEQVVCVDTREAAAAPCAEADLALRTAWRPVRAAGFAVQDPGIYPLSHYSQPAGEQVEIAPILAEGLEQVDIDALEMEALERMPTASLTPNDSLVGFLQDEPGSPVRQDVHVQLTSNMVAAQWRALAAERGDEGITLELGVRCQPLSALDQQGFGTEEMSATVTLPVTGAYDLALVQLCAAEQVDPPVEVTLTQATPMTGLWPDTRSFDLLVEHLDGRLVVRASPGNLVSNETRRTGAQGPDAVDLLALLAAQEEVP